MPTEQELRLHRCCFTGHRPEKIDMPERKVVAALEKEIKAAIADGFVTFISGMARGSDIWAAEIVLHLKKKNPSLHLIAASPYDGFEKSWSLDWQKRYAAIMAEADLIRFICEKQSMSCYQTRNEWMVDHSARVIAVFNGEKGGTLNTIRYAEKHGVPVINVLE
jgi:uncharacterized phage-like protein YoqJ